MDVSSVTQAWPGIFAPSGEYSAFTPGRSSYTAGRRRLSRRVRALLSDLQALPGSLAPSGVSLGLGLTLSQRRMPWVMPQATSSATSQCRVHLRHWHLCLAVFAAAGAVSSRNFPVSCPFETSAPMLGSLCRYCCAVSSRTTGMSPSLCRFSTSGF